MSKNTLYVVDKKNLSPFETYFVVIFHVERSKNVTICTEMIFHEVQTQKMIHKKQ